MAVIPRMLPPSSPMPVASSRAEPVMARGEVSVRAPAVDHLEAPTAAFHPELSADAQARLTEQDAIRRGDKPLSRATARVKTAPDFADFVKTLAADLAWQLGSGPAPRKGPALDAFKKLVQAAPGLVQDAAFARSLVQLSSAFYPLLPESARAAPAVAAAALDAPNASLKGEDFPQALLSDAAFLLERAKKPNASRLGSGFSNDLQTMTEVVGRNPSAYGWASPDVKANAGFQRALKDALLAWPKRSVVLANFGSADLPAALKSDVELMAHLTGNAAARFTRADPSIRTAPALLEALRDAVTARRANLKTFSREDLPTSWRDDSSLAVALAKCPGGYALLSPEQQSRPEVALAYVKAAIPNLEYPEADYVPALSRVPRPLRRDPAIVREAVISDPANLRSATGGLRNDPAIVRTAVDLNGLALQWAGAAQRRDFDTVALAVRQNGDALQHADPALRAHPKLAERALEDSMSRPPWDPERGKTFDVISPDAPNYVTLAIRAGRVTSGMLAAKDPLWNRKPEVVLSLLEAGAPAKGVLDSAHGGVAASLLAQRDFVLQLARAGGPAVLEHLPARWAEDTQVKAWALLGLPDSAPLPDGFGPFLQEQPEVALALVKRNHWRYYALPSELQANRRVVAEALANDEGLVTDIPSSVQNDLPFMRDLLMLNPRALDQLLPSRREALVGRATLGAPGSEAYRALAQARRTLEDQLQSLRITPSRFTGEWQTLKEVIDNRSSGMGSDPRPVALIDYPSADWNGGFNNTNAEELRASGRRVMYFENRTVAESLRKWNEVGRERTPDVVIYGGHGSYATTSLGSDAYQMGNPDYDSPFALNLRDLDALQTAELRDVTASGANVALASCETGRFSGVSGINYRPDIAFMMSQALPDQNVWAPMTSTNLNPEFRRGAFVRPAYNGNDGNVVRIGPG